MLHPLFARYTVHATIVLHSVSKSYQIFIKALTNWRWVFCMTFGIMMLSNKYFKMNHFYFLTNKLVVSISANYKLLFYSLVMLHNLYMCQTVWPAVVLTILALFICFLYVLTLFYMFCITLIRMRKWYFSFNIFFI